jgi:exopolyphosphatase/guanosine-5'-triphosphate,3'-diphosphate pyrophosphatase
MSATHYPLAVMHHYTFEPETCMAFLHRVGRNDVEKMRGIEEVSKNRRALLPYGAIVLEEIIRVMRPARVVVSALGVREGFLYSLLSEEQQRADPLISAAEELALLRSRSVTHAHELAQWTGEALATFGIEEMEDEARYRRTACLLADIGWRAHPEYRGTQSLNIIAHASFIGIDHPGRAFIALVSLFRHEGLFNDGLSPQLRELATPRYLERARLIAALLRVVYLLTAAMPGIIPQLRWEKRADGSLALLVPASHAALIGERPVARMAQLARVSGLNLSLEVANV